MCLYKCSFPRAAKPVVRGAAPRAPSRALGKPLSPGIYLVKGRSRPVWDREGAWAWLAGELWAGRRQEGGAFQVEMRCWSRQAQPGSY